MGSKAKQFRSPINPVRFGHRSEGAGNTHVNWTDPDIMSMSNFLITASPIPDVRIVQPRKFTDDRGFFIEAYSLTAFSALGVETGFVQDNQSLSLAPGTLRGLHFQHTPFAQDKLVRVLRGRIWDVAVDLRKTSPTFGRSFGLELSAENQKQLFVPTGFAHGFLTLERDTEVLYKVSAPYSAAHDAGVAWDDPDLAISWPLDSLSPVLSDKDRTLPRLRSLTEFF